MSCLMRHDGSRGQEQGAGGGRWMRMLGLFRFGDNFSLCVSVN